jgi:hypothetical protein
MIAHLQVAHSRPDFLHHAGAFVAADDGHRGGQVAGPDVVIGMAQSGGLEGHQHFALLRRVEVDFLDAPFLFVVPEDRRVHFHGAPSL